MLSKLLAHTERERGPFKKIEIAECLVLWCHNVLNVHKIKRENVSLKISPLRTADCLENSLEKDGRKIFFRLCMAHAHLRKLIFDIPENYLFTHTRVQRG